MRFSSRLSISAGAIAAIVFIQPAQAQLRQTYTADAAREGAVSVTVWPGSGTNIDFSGLGESVYRIWLDDPSQITVDTDNDLLDGGGAQVIHLRRIEGVDFEGLPSTAQTLLTVATVNQARQTTLYQFPVFYNTGVPDYATIALTLPPPPVLPEPTIQVSTAPLGRATLETVQLGLASFVREGTVAANGPLADRVKAFLSQVRNGSTPVEAAAAAAIDMQVIEQLAARGLAEARAQREATLFDELPGTEAVSDEEAIDSEVPQVEMPAGQLEPFVRDPKLIP